jgi:hypothetical protein
VCVCVCVLRACVCVCACVLRVMIGPDCVVFMMIIACVISIINSALNSARYYEA